MILKEKAESKLRPFLVVIVISILLVPAGSMSLREDMRWRKEYEQLQTRALLYARSCGIRGKSEVIKKAYDYSVRFWLRWPLVVRWISAESDFITSATSYVNARGLTQVRGSTAEYICEILTYSDLVGLTEKEKIKVSKKNYNLYDVEDNLLIGFAYLKFLSTFSDNSEEALARYLAGKRWPEFLDSRYVKSISDGKPIVNLSTFD